MVQVVWFKRDLRTSDHRPLAEAAASGPVIPLYIAEADYWALPGSSCRQWRAQSGALAELAQRLEALGAPLIIRSGSAVECLARIHRALGIARLLAHQETGNGWTYERDKNVRRFCRANGIPFFEYPQFGVVRGLRDRDDWGRLHRAFLSGPLIPEPAALIAASPARPGSIPAAGELGLGPDGCAAPQPGTRRAALGRLESFLKGRGAHYRRAMSNPLEGAEACSRLSVPLATGAISIRETLSWIFAARSRLVKLAPETRPVPLAALDSLVSRLHWHCHFIQKLESEPELEFRSLHPAHEAFRAASLPGPAVLEAWAAGQTGFPFVDACMRSLMATGWLNFRMRAMAQAFASYHLGLDWRASGTRLAQLFTDYEPGIHWPQVQMQAGQTGINTPRLYNPVKQGLDQDFAGVFTKTWVPELVKVPVAFLQTPWKMDAALQSAAGCMIGTDYPAPLVDAAAAITSARMKLAEIRRQPGYREAAQAVYLRHGSRQRRLDADDPAKAKAIQAERKIKSARQLTLDL